MALIWKKDIFDLLFKFFSHQEKVTKIPSAHIHSHTVTINLTKAEIAYNFSGSDLINDYEYTVINFYNNNLILIMYL